MTRIEIHALDCTYVRINFAILVVILIKKRQLIWILNGGNLCLTYFQAEDEDNKIKID